ncbi:Protein OPAQUE10 [Euphorbia peplus]|nr:Protein OPAQUE10 [Euphorbia peplus]
MLVHLPQAAGESSPTSPDNFRQLDDVFLQTQTRIWLGEVLRTRLNEQRSIADLLADGELLFEVSKEVWKMMLSERPELKAYAYEPFASRNGGRYMPYSFVDSFLKMCKILGLNGIDLFSPSDVVEKGDTRKVCMCLRALSNKTRSLHLNVPDFDIVTSTVAMPTDMVGYIRRSWELSLSEYSTSANLAQHQKLRQRSSREHLSELCGRNYLSVKEFDDSETNSMLQSDSAISSYLYNSSSDLSSKSMKAKNDCLDLGVSLVHEESGSGISCRSNSSIFDECVASSSCCSNSIGDKNEYTSQFLDGDNVEMFSIGSVNSKSSCVRNLDFDDELEIEEAFPQTPNGKLGEMSVKVTEGSESQGLIKHGTAELIFSNNKKEESLRVKGMDSRLSMHKCGADKDDTGFIDHLMQYDKNTSKIRSNLNAGVEGKESFATESCFAHGYSQWDQKGKCQVALVPSGNVGCDALSQSRSLLDTFEQNLQYIQREVVGDGLQPDKECNTVMVESDPDACKQTNGCSKNAIISSHDGFDKSCSIVENENTTKNEETIQKLEILIDEQTDTREMAKSRPQKRPLLKAVVSGTAVVGATLLLLHFRKNGRENSPELGKQSNGARSTNGRNLALGKAQKARKADGAYPADKFKF